MIKCDYFVIGAGPGGYHVCEGIRQYDKKGTVTLVGAEPELPYQRPPLSKDFLTQKRVRPETLHLCDDAWFARRKIDFRKNRRVVNFNLERRLAVLDTGQTFEFRKACLATGSRPRRPEVAGATLGNVLYLRSLDDAMAIREVIGYEKNITVVGGGLLAVEAASAICKGGHSVTLLFQEEFVWQHLLDSRNAAWLTQRLEQQGIRLMPRESLNGFEGKTVLKNIQTKSGQRFPAGAAIVSIGAEPNLDLVWNTPLSSPSGTPVNEYLETEEKGIYAVGDLALYPDSLFGGVRRVTHWDAAVEQGKVAGANMTGRRRQKLQYLPRFESMVFDDHFVFIGDFQRPGLRADVEGSREKGKFTLTYRQGEKITGVVLCNPGAAELRAAEKCFPLPKKKSR